MFHENKILICSCLKRKTDASKTAKTAVNFEEQDKQGTFHMIFTTSEGSRFLAWKCWKKAWMQANIFCGIFSEIVNFLVGFVLYWLRWIRSLYVIFVHYNKRRKPAKVFFLSHPSVIASYSVVISILLLFLLPSKELPLRIKYNKQESSTKLFSQFNPTPVRSGVLRMFSKRCHYFVRLPPFS